MTYPVHPVGARPGREGRDRPRSLTRPGDWRDR